MDLLNLRTLPFLTRRNYYFEFWHLLPWSVLVGLVEGQFASVVVSKSFSGSPLLVSIATATPVGSLLFSLFWGMLCAGRPKIRLATLFASGTALCASLTAAIPTSEFGAIWFVVQIAASQVFLAGVVTVRSAIWRSNYPRASRGRIAARLQAVRFLISVFTVLAAAALCDKNPSAFRIIYPCAAGFGVIGILFLQRLHIRGERKELAQHKLRGTDESSLKNGTRRHEAVSLFSPKNVFGQAFRVLRNDRRFRTYCIAQILIGIANLMTFAVVVLIITRDLPLSGQASFWISSALITSLPRLVMLGCLGRWGRLFDRIGVVRFRVVNVLVWTSSLVFGLIACRLVIDDHCNNPSVFLAAIAFFVLRAIFQGLGYGGGALAWNLGHLHFAKPEEAEIYMGIHVSLTGLRGTIAPLGGMWLWQYAGLSISSVWAIAIGLSLCSLAIFLRMARQEKREGRPTAPGDA